ncbi:hypothetical protein ABPG72_021310 [Tetrahymena utriculariae]
MYYYHANKTICQNQKVLIRNILANINIQHQNSQKDNLQRQSRSLKIQNIFSWLGYLHSFLQLMCCEHFNALQLEYSLLPSGTVCVGNLFIPTCLPKSNHSE